MMKDYESKRKFEKLKKSDSNRTESFKKKLPEEDKVEKIVGKKIISPTDSDQRSDVTFRKDKVNKFNENDLQIEDMNIESSNRNKSRYFIDYSYYLFNLNSEPSGRSEKLQKLVSQKYTDKVEEIKQDEISRLNVKKYINFIRHKVQM